MKRFMTTVAAVIAAQLLLGGMGVLGLFIFTSALIGQAARPPVVPSRATLVQEIPSSPLEFDLPQRLPFGHRPTTHTMILENLEKARRDEHIAQVVLKLDPCVLGWGKLEEIRERIAQLRDAGKQVHAYTWFVNNRALYLASACDSIHVAPEGFVLFTGLMGERMYVKDLLTSIGVDVQLSRIKEYKSAPEMYVRTEMSPEVRANATRVLDDLYSNLRLTIARDRGVDPARVDEWMEIGQFDPLDAQAAGMIDGVLVWEALVRRLQGSASEFAAVDGEDYAKVARAQFGQRGPKVAVVHGQGTIATGESGNVFPFGLSMGEETMVAAIDAAADDDAVKGILLRLDTPGGMGLASERIGQAVERAAAAKPLVVSTVDMNASGGYMVSYRAGTIVAPGGAIVGSIGSFSMRPNFAGLMDKLGITWDRVTIGPHATYFSSVMPLTEEEFRRFDSVHRSGYGRWIAGVARCRGLSVEQVDFLGRGQVYTGRQALANGLIDHVGGFDTALGLLKEQMGLSPDEQVTLLHYPVPTSLLDELLTGDWPDFVARVGAGLGCGAPLAEQLAGAKGFWEAWLRAQDDLQYCEWRY
ncbi:MAG: S49 family peptidase [Candidatus Eisenbacteria bacterium]